MPKSIQKENMELRYRERELTMRMQEMEQKYDELLRTSGIFEEKSNDLCEANETLHEIILKLIPEFM